MRSAKDLPADLLPSRATKKKETHKFDDQGRCDGCWSGPMAGGVQKENPASPSVTEVKVEPVPFPREKKVVVDIYLKKVRTCLRWRVMDLSMLLRDLQGGELGQAVLLDVRYPT